MNKNRTILILLIGLFFLNSCSVEQELNEPDGIIHEIAFTAKLPTAELAATRATEGTLAENRIRQLDMLVFEKDGNLKEIKQVIPTYEDADLTKKTVKFKTRLTAGNYDFMLVANARSLVSFAVDGTVSQADVAAALIFTQENILSLSDTDTGVIPMWALLKDATVANGAIDKTVFPTNASTDAGLTRIYAKVNVSAADIATTTFELKSVDFYNYNTKGRIVPESAKYPLNTNSNSPSLPTKPIPGTGTVNNTATGTDFSPYTFGITSTNKCENKIYVLEAATVAAYGGANWVKNPCLIIGGKYDGASNPITYYRIDFIGKNKAGATGQWLSILRNHIYEVTITAVTDKGYDDKEKALNSAPVNMTSTVTPWNDGTISNVVVDGQYALGVSQTEVILSPDASTNQESNALTIVTNYVNDADGTKNWSAQLSTNATTIVAPSTGLTLSASKGTGNYPTGNKIYLNTTFNGTGSNRTTYVHITAGRLKIVVKVVQETPTLTVTKEASYYAPVYGKTYTVNVKANYAWKISNTSGATQLLSNKATDTFRTNTTGEANTITGVDLTFTAKSSIGSPATANLNATFVAQNNASITQSVTIPLKYVRPVAGKLAEGTILAVDQTGKLNLDGYKPGNYIVYFRYGSTVALCAPETFTDGDAFDPIRHVAWVPSNYVVEINKYDDIFHASSQDFPAGQYPKAGLGDPCGLVGSYRTPSFDELHFFRSADVTINGQRGQKDPSGQFYPYEIGAYWPYGFELEANRSCFYANTTIGGLKNNFFLLSSISAGGGNTEAFAYPIRCIPK